MKPYKNNIQKIEFIESENLLIQTWQKDSEDLEEDDFKKEMLELSTFFLNLQPQKVLIDMREFYFLVVPEIQDWVNENVNSKLSKLHDTKTAFVVSPDFFTAVSVEQTLEEANGKKLNNKFFEEYNQAVKWLKNG